MLIRLSNAKNALEIGSGVCYSSLWLSLGLASTGGRLTTIDSDASLVEIARQNIMKAGVDGRVKLIQGDALRIIPELKEEYDLVFIDGNKPDYLLYFDRLMPLVKVGGIVAAHDINGMPEHMRDYFDMLKMHPCLDTVLTTDTTGDANVVVAGPGISLSHKTSAAQDGVRAWGRHLARSVIPGTSPAPSARAASHEILRRYSEARFQGAEVLADRSASTEELLSLCKQLRRQYTLQYPDYDLAIHVYTDREVFDNRNNLNYPGGKYFAGYFAQVYVNAKADCDEIRRYS